MTIPTGRKIFARFFVATGLFEILSGLFINPWLNHYWDRSHLAWQNDYFDVTLQYFIWAVGLGALTVLFGFLIARKRSRVIDNMSMTFLILSLIVVTDRYLLSRHGLSIWVADPVVYFRHRPNAVRTWPTEYTRGKPKPVRINRYGHHDDNFPVTKPPGEFRAVVLGDSVTMGHGVTAAETYANQLEALLNRDDKKYRSHQIINTAVSGYATAQEYQILKESLRFAPDMVFIGFCMNDATEPFVSDRNYGGIGFGNQGIIQFKNSFLGYLYHETGFGRWIEHFLRSGRLREYYARQEIYNVDYMTNHLDDPRIQRAWNTVLGDLEKIYRLCEADHIPVVLLIFPHTFQLVKDTNGRTPQKILKEHASRFRIPVIDFAVIFQELMAKQIVPLQERHLSREAINALMAKYLLTYFLDWDHLTVRGHGLIARVLFDFLRKEKVIAADKSLPIAAPP